MRSGSSRQPPWGASRRDHRHQTCLQRMRARLGEAEEDWRGGSPELTHAAAGALEAAGEVVGTADTEEILGKIFSTFCIGK